MDRTDKWRYNKYKRLVDYYLDQSNLERSQSELLILIKIIKNIANKNNVSFELLLQLISENNWLDIKRQMIKEDFSTIESLLDLIDDSILCLDIEYDDADFIEKHFKNSLAYIQAEKDSEISQEEVLNFLSARNEGIKIMLNDIDDRKAFIKGGIPLRSCSKLFELIEPLKLLISEYHSTNKETQDLVKLLEEIETLLITLPTFENIREEYTELINKLRFLWISGEPLNTIIDIDKNALYICTSYFGYKIPFLLNAISKKMKDEKMEDKSNFISELAILCELGLPNMLASKIFLTGIRSRISALELSENINKRAITFTIKQLQNGLVKIKDKIKDKISNNTYSWLNLLSEGIIKERRTVNAISNFSISTDSDYEETLIVRSFQNRLYLCSPDYEFTLDVTENNFNFISVADMLDVNFIFDEVNEHYQMNVRNPKLTVK